MSATLSAPAPRTLRAATPLALTTQAVLLVTAALALPALVHLAGLPVRWLLPMHWPVVLAGLCYGWRSGLVIGAAAPVTAYLLSGMPPPVVLPPMTLELATYGFLAGFVRQVLGRGRVEAALGAAVGGRLVFIAAMLATGAIVGPLSTYLQQAMLPGLPAAAAQAALLPLVAGWWVRRASHR